MMSGAAPNARRHRPSLMTVGEAWHRICGRVDTAEFRAGAQQLKVVGAGDEHFDAFGTLAAEQRRTDRPHGADALEDAGALAEIVQLGLRDTDVPAIGRPRVRRDTHEAVRVWKRQRADQHRVYDREDRDVRADAKRKREDRNRSEPWCGDDSSEPVAQVA